MLTRCPGFFVFKPVRVLFLLSVVLVGLLPLGAQEKQKDPVGLIGTLRGHTELVYSVAFSPDGKHLVTGSFDNTIKLWEVASGKEIKTFGGPAGHQKMVLSVALSPDGQMLASGSVDNTLKFWDVPTSIPLRTVDQAEAINAIALSADGTKLALAGKDGTIKIVNAGDFKPLLSCKGKHEGPATGVAFSANGQILASSGADKTLRFWNATNGEPISRVGAHHGPVNAVLLHPNNTAAFSAGEDGLLKFWQVPPTPTRALPVHGGSVLALALSADGNQVLTGSADKTIKVSTPATGKELRTLTGATAPVTSATFNANASLVAAGTEDGRLMFWNNADGKPLGQGVVAHNGSVTGVSFHPQNTQLLSAGKDGLLKLWSMPPVPGRAFTHPEAVLAAVMSPDGKRFFTGSADKVLRSWDVAKGQVERQYTGHSGPVTAAATSANGQILVSAGADNTIRFWNQTTGKEADILGSHAGTITSLALNAAGNQLLSSSEDGTLKLWQLPVVAPKTLPHPDQVTALALSSDGGKLVTGCTDKQVRLWNLATSAKERDFVGATLPVNAVALSPDGKFIAGGAADKTVLLWSAGDGKLLHKVTLPAAVNGVAFSADGKLLAAGLADNSIKLFNTGDGKEARTLAGHKGPVAALAVSPKGELISASADKTVQIWNLSGGPAKTKLEHSGPVAGLALSKDGSRLAAATDKSVKVWNLADGKELATLGTPAEVKGVGFSPDGSRLVVAGADKIARVYELNGTLVEFFTHEGPVLAAGFADGKRVVTGSADKTARVWTSSLMWQRSHGGPVRQALFSPKGDQVLSAADDKTVRLWNIADGKELKSIPAHDGPAMGLGISADGTKLTTAGSDKVVKIWNLAAKPGTPEEKKPVSSFALAAAPQAVAFSPNGLRLAVGVTEDKANLIRVFDVALGREVQVIGDHSAGIRSLAFLGDNRTLVSASADKTARLSDVGVLTILDAHKDGVVSAHFHSSGTQAVTAGADKTIKIWDLAKGIVIRTIGPLPETIKAVTYNRDFTQVGAAVGKTAKVWNLADGKEVLNLPHSAEVLSLSFSVDKTRIVTGAADKLARVWEVATGRELQFFPQEDAVQAVVFEPKNTSIIAAGGKTPVVETISVTRVIPVSKEPVYGLALTPQNTHVLTAGTDKQVKMWNIANGNNERTFQGGDVLRTVTVSKNNLLVAAGGTDKSVRLFTLADGKEIGAVKVGDTVRSLTFTPNSQALAATSADKSLTVWNTIFTAGQPIPKDFLSLIQSFKTAGEPIAKDFLTPIQSFKADLASEIVIGPDNATIYSGSLDKNLQAWRLASPTPTKSFPHPNHVDSVAFSPDGKLLASGAHDGKVRIFDVVKGVQLREINAHTVANATMIYCVAFSPDSKQVVSASYDNSLKLWDANSGNLVREFKAYKPKEFEKGHQDSVFSAAISPDGKFLASGSGGLERLIKIWNMGDGTVVRDLANPNLKAASPMQPPPSHPGWVYNLRWTKDGKHLVSAGDAPLNKGYLSVWDPHGGKLLYGEEMALGTFFGLALSPDNQVLALGAGPRGRPTSDFNCTYLLKMPPLGK